MAKGGQLQRGRRGRLLVARPDSTRTSAPSAPPRVSLRPRSSSALRPKEECRVSRKAALPGAACSSSSSKQASRAPERKRSLVVPSERPQRLGGDDRFYAGSATTPTAASTNRSAAAASSRPTSAAATTWPRTWRCNRMAASSSSAGPRAPRSSAWASSATSPTARWTPASTVTGSSRPTSGKGEFGQDVAIQSDGKIVAAGYTANGVDTEFALIRANP